ncbi:MAG: fructosamine kinase family protein, partial [Chloroflexota bacterium]
QIAYAANFGRALAKLHHITAATFGLDHDNFIGELPQPNTPTATWAQFYRDQRIAVQIEIARDRNYLPPYREAMLRTMLDRIESILGGAPNPPSLIHGDLWSGNYFAAPGNQPALFDPAVYYGDRELEIAYAELFGASPFFLDAYRVNYPLDPGYEYRRPLLQLYAMLVHLNHFGEQYGEHVDAICRHYLT